MEVVVDVGSVAGVGRLEGPRNRDSRRRSGATAAFDLDLSAGDVPLGRRPFFIINGVSRKGAGGT